MKNTLFLDDTFTPELLENEEALADETRNTIWLRFTTSAATNQKLQIFVRANLHEISLTPSTEYIFELEGQYWAPGGTTSIRITNSAFTSELTYITFPEIVSVDAAIQEQNVENREYYLQGKTNQAEEIKTFILVYKNGTEYNINSLAKIAEFYFLTRDNNTKALMTLTLTVICSEITTTAEIEFRLRLNNVFDEVFTPTHTATNGKYIITITYPVENISSSINNHLEVFMKMSEGNGQILQGGAIATLSASGVIQGTEDAWDGNLDIIENISSIAVAAPATAIIQLYEDTDISQTAPGAAAIAETINAVTLAPLIFTLASMTESVIIGRKSSELVITPSRATEYTFNANYVNVTTTFALRTDYTYLGTAGVVDSGHMTSVEIPLDDFSSVSEVTVV